MANQASQLVGILLANTGTPAAPTASALRPYLAEFLGDRRIIELPRWLWLPILHGFILTTRPQRSAKLYRRIWTENGSPLLIISQRLAEGAPARLADRGFENVRVIGGMRYGHPSVAEGLRALRAAGARRILIFPLFPQYSATTTASIMDAAFAELRAWRQLPEIRTIVDYHDHPAYLGALAGSIRDHWQAHGQPERLLFSFHGIPKRYAAAGDPYPEQCRATARLVAERIGLKEREWLVSFQSRFGPVEWLKPYTDEVLAAWGKEQAESINVVCPGFSADCLETIDEINREGRKAYEEAGGRGFVYIPALNDRPAHMEALAEIAAANLQGWA